MEAVRKKHGTLKLTYHKLKNKYPDFVADLTYNKKQIPDADYARIIKKYFKKQITNKKLKDMALREVWCGKI